MECNKEEAIRAMEVAEKKMQNKDFVSARKTAGRAQQLYPDLLNISQMILVCDVHCAAQNKVYGGESDWYGILQIEPTADEAAIKKQFRKLALSLHPDKNKFAGASDAFKMIGEAQKVLLDREKRIIYDSKCKAVGKYQPSKWATHQGSRQTNVRGHPWFQSKFMSSSTSQFGNQQHQQQQQQQNQSELVNNRPTFWTICPFCSVKYQFYKDVVNKTLHCQNCKKSFTGYEMNPPGGIPGANSSQPTFPQRTSGVCKGNSATVPQSIPKNSSSKKAPQESVNIKNINRESFPEKRFTPTVGEESTRNENYQRKNMKNNRLKKSRDSKLNSKKRNMSSESSENCCSESSTDSGGDVNINEDGDGMLGQNSGYHGDHTLRRSSRGKQRVSYDENLSGDDEANPSKRTKYSGSFPTGCGDVKVSVKKEADLAADMEENEKEVKHKDFSSPDEVLQDGEKDTEKSSVPQFYEYPDPDFNDFDKYRKKECFAVGQVWAIYDMLDAMPRFYALIRNILPFGGFKLKITWLEPNPDDEDKVKWVKEGLPASCGKFIRGHSEVCEEHPMFSHLVDWKRGSKRSTFEIYPTKGETWALFKNWDINWHSDPRRKKGYEYEFVEVLSEYADNRGVHVAYLGKLKGFACLFCRMLKDGIESFLIPPKHIFRFSHKVPSFRMSGEEGKDIPRGSFELDPASLPASLVGIGVSQNLDMDARRMHRNSSCSGSHEDILEPKENSKEHVSSTEFVELKVRSKEKAAEADFIDVVEESEKIEALEDKVELKAKSEGDSFLGHAERVNFQNYNSNGSGSSANKIEDSSTPASESYEIPEPEFYNFDAEKDMDKFQVGQIWALYGDEDALPKYYGRIKKIDSPPRFALHLTWLAPCSLTKDVIQWTNKEMPICCGNFKLGKGKPQMFTSTGPFSHQLRVKSKDEKNIYSVFPEKGDVWALYKNWSSAMTCSDLDNCEYDLVEILDKNEVGITVLFLELVTGFKSVFKPQTVGQSTVGRQIPWAELLRFSHQIPSFRLTEEKDGSLRGFWELDPAALPIYLFCSS